MDVVDEAITREEEFTYLHDQKLHLLIEAFQLRPDDLPGFGFLSKSACAHLGSEGVCGGCGAALDPTRPYLDHVMETSK